MHEMCISSKHFCDKFSQLPKIYFYSLLHCALFAVWFWFIVFVCVKPPIYILMLKFFSFCIYFIYIRSRRSVSAGGLQLSRALDTSNIEETKRNRQRELKRWYWLSNKHPVDTMETSKRLDIERAQNFMRKYRDPQSRELRQLTSHQFIEVWSHYDRDG